MDYELAKKLASQGASNAEIFGALEITSGALQAIMQTNPKLLFAILQGRAGYIAWHHDEIMKCATGQEPLSRTQYQAVLYLLERAEQQSRALTVAHEMILIEGQPMNTSAIPQDSATVTQLLRKTR